MIIEILEDGSNLVNIITEEKGRKKEKLITMGDFISSVLSANDKGKAQQVLGPLYKELQNIKLIQFKHITKRTKIYILLREKAKAPMILFDKFYGEIGHPQLLFGVKVVNDKVSNLYVVATRDEEITEDTILYRYPFTNVSGDNGAVCLGGNRFEKGVKEGDKLLNVPNEFFSMPNTAHSYSILNNTKGLELGDLITELVEKDFDDELLVEHPRTSSYKNWINMLG